MARSVSVLAIDRIACDGHGLCAELLPEVIELDDWGYPIIVREAVPRELLGHARKAVAICPVLALRIRTVAAGEVGAAAPIRQHVAAPRPG